MMRNQFLCGLSLLLAGCLLGCDRGEAVQPALTITDVTPGTTRLGGSTLNTALVGDTLVITGENFSPVTTENQVSVQAIAAPVIGASPTEIKALVPLRTPLTTVDLVVARTGYLSATAPITVRSTPSPVITGIRPLRGQVGSVVTILGRHLLELADADQADFTGASGQGARVYIRPFQPLLVTGDSIQLRVPPGAGTGKITLYARPDESVKDTFFGLTTPVFTVLP